MQTMYQLCFGEIICQIFLCCGWSGYYPPTSYEIMQNKFLGELFVRFLKAMHNVTNQPVTIQINIMQTKCLRKYFFSDTSGENTTNQNKWPNIPSIEVPTTLSMYLLIICWVDPKQLYICWCTMAMCIKNTITHIMFELLAMVIWSGVFPIESGRIRWHRWHIWICVDTSKKTVTFPIWYQPHSSPSPPDKLENFFL